MKKILEKKTINIYLLKPIISMFFAFFVIVMGLLFYIENITDVSTSEKILLLSAVMFLLFLIIFFIIRYYIFRFKNVVLEQYEKNVKKIESSRIYLKKVEDASSNLIISAIGNKIEKVNKAFLNFTNYKNLDEFYLYHKCLGELFIPKKGYLHEYNDGVHWVDYVFKDSQVTHKVIMLKENVEYIFMVDCTEIIIDDIKRVMYTLVDITEFENLQTRYQLAINGTNDGLWDWNLLTNEVYFSPQWKKQMGFEDNELPCEFKSWEDRVHPDDLEHAMIDIQNNVEGKTLKYENQHRLRHKDGSWVWILDRGQTIFDEQNTPVRMVGFHTDITEKVRIEEELHQKDEMMIAQSQNAAMGEMISMIAHQWRQPLSVISMCSNNIIADIQLEMLDNKTLEDTALEITAQTAELSKTIDDFREFFKPKKNKEVVNIQDVISDALSIIGKSLENNDIIVTQNIKSEQKIKTHSRELLQVLLNLLKNAKEILVENIIHNREIVITTSNEKDNLIIEIQDNAGGIPKWVLPKIFEPYFSTKNDKTGTGLGLYMCKTIVEKHLNGKIIVSNKEGGASFKLILQTENNNE